MSFGFAIGDFIATANLTWRLHQDCYKVIQDCPQDIKELARDLATIYGVLKHIEEDLESAGSVIKSHGERRGQLLQSMVMNLQDTLERLHKLVFRYQKIANRKDLRSNLWDKVRWIGEQKKVGKIRQDLAFHISSFNLILASMGNSSLYRVERGLAQLRLSSVEQGGYPTISSGGLNDLESPQIDAEGESCESEPGETCGDAHAKGLSRKTLEKLTREEQRALAATIIAVCQQACFEFYEKNELYRTKFHSKDTHFDRKLFQLTSDQDPDYVPGTLHSIVFPESAFVFSLTTWICKLRIAWSRCNKEDSICYSAVENGNGFIACLGAAERIPIINQMTGTFARTEFEEAIKAGIELCNSLRAWAGKTQLERVLKCMKEGYVLYYKGLETYLARGEGV
ncbi:MAG: hypothetical protein M1839_001255 [Geoglossum umbratile]|nr:MAG: hypothetical protein M1839_001255 [Geoglossum umbratile]